MKSYFHYINNYKQQIQHIKNTLPDNYYSVNQLLSQIDKSQTQIQELLKKSQNKSNLLAIKNKVKANKLSIHPLRFINSPIQVLSNQSSCHVNTHINSMQPLIIPNSKFTLSITPLALHPYKRIGIGNCLSHRIPKSFKFLTYWGHKMNETSFFKYNRAINLHKNATGGKLDQILITHYITLSNIDVLKQVIGSGIVQIYVQNQFGIILGSGQIQIGSQVGQEKTRMLEFRQLGQGDEIFTLECKVLVTNQLISPQLIQLKQKFHYSRVICHSPNRSRSPSPTLHKHTAQSIIKKKSKVLRTTIFDGLPLIYLLCKKGKYEQLNKKGKQGEISYKDNISDGWCQFYQGNNEKEGEIHVEIWGIIQDKNKQGFFECKMDIYTLKVTILPNTILQIIPSPNSARILSSSKKSKTPMINPKLTQILSLTNNFYIRQNHPYFNIKTHHRSIQQKIYPHSLIEYSFLTQNQIDPTNINILHGTIYSINKTDNSIKIRFFLNNIPNNKKQIITLISIKSTNNQQNHQLSVQQHIIKYLIEQPPPPIMTVNLIIPQLSTSTAKQPTYVIDLGALSKKSRYIVRSSNPQILKILKQQFDYSQDSETIQVEIMSKAAQKMQIEIYLINTNKNTFQTVNVLIKPTSLYQL